MTVSMNVDDSKLHVGDETAYGRFKIRQGEAQGRMDVSELTNGQFMNVLLDVYELHLENDD